MMSMDTTLQGTCFHAKQPHKSRQNPHPIYSDLLLFGIDLLVGPRRFHPSSLTSKPAVDSQEEQCIPISIMMQFRPIWKENLLFSTKTALPSQKSLCSGKYVLFLHDFSFVCPGHTTTSYLSPPSSSYQSSCQHWPLIITPGSILNCMTKFWVGQGWFFFLIYTPIILPGRTMQQLTISVPWCSNYLSSVGWITELYLFYFWEVHESLYVSITILDWKKLLLKRIVQEKRNYSKATLMPQLFSGCWFCSKVYLENYRKGSWKISKRCRGKSYPPFPRFDFQRGT